MTLMTAYNFIPLHVCVFLSNMEKNTQKLMQGTKPNSVALDHAILDGQSSWSRCSSFSSCSNDSAVYCSSRHLQSSSFQVGKRLAAENNSPRLSKRNRNSSGSSVSSNMSCISDKDVKKASVIISPNCLPQESVSSTGIRNNITKLSSLDCREVNSRSVELQHKTILNERLSCSDHTTALSPFRHNLRRSIRKKTCSCDCTATCTTLVVRRYKEIGKKTVEEKTVISSTKVKTFVQKNAPKDIHRTSNTNNMSTKPETNRKRRSEIQKLYDSLHEIEWAKNFSPDNILRQINIRQAASCSVFGRPSPNQTNSCDKSSKRQKEMNNHRLRSSTRNKSALNVNHVKVKSKRVNVKNEISPSSYKITTRRRNAENRCSSNKVISAKVNVGDDNKERIVSKIEKEVSSLNFHLYEKTNNCESQSSMDSTTCSSHISMQEVTIKSPSQSPETIPHSRSLAMNDNDAQLSIDSSSSGSGNSVEMPKNFLDLEYRYKPNAGVIPPVDMSEYSVTPTFFDIAEEGIRTIDACFREVGAEVVVSTCYEDECDLPRLTSVKDTGVSNKISVDDGPPVLEPCVDITDKKLQTLSFNVDAKKDGLHVDDKSTNKCNIPCGKTVTLQDDSDVKGIYEVDRLKNIESHASNKSNNELIYSEGRRILNKYLKYFRSRGKLRCLPIVKQNKLVKENSELEETSQKSINRFSQNGISMSKYNSSHNQNLVPSSSASSSSSICSTSSSFFKSHDSPCQTFDRQMKQSTLSQTLNQKVSICNYPSKIRYDYNKNDSFMYHAEKNPLTHQGAMKKISSASVVQKSPGCCYIEHTSLTSSSYSTTKTEKDSTRHENEHVPRPPTSFGFSCHYKSIRVNRNNSYTQVVLKLTRGRSIFLTLEALRELRDVVNRTAIDLNSQVLILNGIGDSFCLGLDLKPLIGPKKIKSSTDMAIAIKELIEALSDFKKPFVAVVNGPALGLGMTLLNHADVTIASDSATFCMPYSNLGYIPEGGATLTLPQAVGSTVAMDLLLRGRTLTAHEARSVGLITEVLEAKRLPHELVSRVKMLAENSISALETTKAMLRMRLHLELQLVLENEVKLLPRMWLSRSCQDSLQSALRSGILAE